MVGAVVHQEMLLGSRRNRLHVLRWLYAGWLVLQVLYFYFQFEAEVTTRRFVGMTRTMPAGAPPWPQVPLFERSAPETVGRWFTETFIVQQMILLLLATPAFVAGAITDEKRRGTLQYLLTTDLEDRHIVLGKLLGRVAQVGLLALAGLPLFCYLAGFAGVSPVAVAASLLVLVVPLLSLGSATVLASVWCRQTRDAVLSLYVVGLVGWLLVWRVGGPLQLLNPAFVLQPAWGSADVREADLPELGRRLFLSTLAWGGIGAVCLGLAIWRLRPAYLTELQRVRPGGLRWLGGSRPLVGSDPVRWRERNVEGLAPLPVLRQVPRGAAICLIAGATAASSVLILLANLQTGRTLLDLAATLLSLDFFGLADLVPEADEWFLVQAVLVMLVASLVVGIRCSGAITGERERKTWESLLLSPLTAREVVQGKLWGVMGASHDYLLAYAVPALGLSLFAGPLAFLYTLLGLGVTLLVMYFLGAAGLWCSVKSKNSWRSLLATLALGYVAGALIYVLSLSIILPIAYMLIMLLYLIDASLGTAMGPAASSGLGVALPVFSVASCIGGALVFIWTARQFLAWTQRWIADRDRTRHWEHEPVYRRRKRAAAR